MFEPDGINAPDDVNATIALAESLPEMRSASAMVSDTSSSFENMPPDEIKFELGQPFTFTLTLDPTVLLPMVTPLMVMQNGNDALIPPPEMLKITELEEKGPLDTDNDELLLQPAETKAASDGWKKSSGNLKVIRLPCNI